MTSLECTIFTVQLCNKMIDEYISQLKGEGIFKKYLKLLKIFFLSPIRVIKFIQT